MRHWEFFLPRTFRMTNGMLADLRAAGYAAAVCHGRARSHPRDDFNDEVASIRRDVGILCRRWVKPTGEPVQSLSFDFYFVGHERHDRDSWLLPAKYLVDGIADALGLKSDRKLVRGISGQVAQTVSESEQWKVTWMRRDECWEGPGVIVTIAQELP